MFRRLISPHPHSIVAAVIGRQPGYVTSIKRRKCNLPSPGRGEHILQLRRLDEKGFGLELREAICCGQEQELSYPYIDKSIPLQR
jgi:hypothetical protein